MNQDNLLVYRKILHYYIYFCLCILYICLANFCLLTKKLFGLRFRSILLTKCLYKTYPFSYNQFLDQSQEQIIMDPRIPERFLTNSSKAKGISVSRSKTNKLQRQQRCVSVETNLIPSCAIENLMLSLQMYLTSARLVSRLADNYYDSVDFLLTEEDRENLLKIMELRQDIKNEVNDIDQYLQNILNRMQRTEQ